MKASLALLLFAAACGGAPAPSAPVPPAPAAAAPRCDQAVAHIRELALVASGARTDDQKTAALREIDPVIAQVADECEAPETQWTDAFRRCVMAAQDRAGVQQCDAQNAPARDPAAAAP